MANSTCDNCGSKIIKKMFCCDACRKSFARKALNGLIIVRQDGQKQARCPLKRTKPDIVYEDEIEVIPFEDEPEHKET